MDNNNLNNQDQNPYQQQDIYQQNTQNTYQQQAPYQQNPYQQSNIYQQQNPYQQPNIYQQQNPYQADGSELEEPISFADWMVTMLLMYIPCVNLIMLFVWGFGSGTKKSKSNYCRAMLVWMLIVSVLSVIMVIALLPIIAMS